MDTPFNIHSTETFKPLRRATVLECRQMVAAAHPSDRTWGNEFFPAFGPRHDFEDVRRYLKKIDAE